MLPGVMRNRTPTWLPLIVLVLAFQAGENVGAAKRIVSTLLADMTKMITYVLCDDAVVARLPGQSFARSLASSSPQCGAQDTCNGQRYTVGQYYCLALGTLQSPLPVSCIRQRAPQPPHAKYIFCLSLSPMFVCGDRGASTNVLAAQDNCNSIAEFAHHSDPPVGSQQGYHVQ